MGKWTQEGYEVVWGGETPVCVSADKYSGATEIITRHNADIAALTERAEKAEAERDELKARLARVVEMLKNPHTGEISESNPDLARIGSVTHTCAVLYSRAKAIAVDQVDVVDAVDQVDGGDQVDGAGRRVRLEGEVASVRCEAAELRRAMKGEA